MSHDRLRTSMFQGSVPKKKKSCSCWESDAPRMPHLCFASVGCAVFPPAGQCVAETVLLGFRAACHYLLAAPYTCHFFNHVGAEHCPGEGRVLEVSQTQFPNLGHADSQHFEMPGWGKEMVFGLDLFSPRWPFL